MSLWSETEFSLLTVAHTHDMKTSHGPMRVTHEERFIRIITLTHGVDRIYIEKHERGEEEEEESSR